MLLDNVDIREHVTQNGSHHRPHRQCAERKVRNHLLVRKLVAVSRLDHAVQHQHAPKGFCLQQRHILTQQEIMMSGQLA